MNQPTVLVVDDEPKIRDIVRRYLEADGFTVTEQADGPGALDAAREQHPDLIVLDVMLPGLDGVEVLRRLRETSQVPVILLTARDEEVDKLIGLAVGADDYMTKPFTSTRHAAMSPPPTARPPSPPSTSTSSSPSPAIPATS